MAEVAAEARIQSLTWELPLKKNKTKHNKDHSNITFAIRFSQSLFRYIWDSSSAVHYTVHPSIVGKNIIIGIWGQGLNFSIPST